MCQKIVVWCRWWCDVDGGVGVVKEWTMNNNREVSMAGLVAFVDNVSSGYVT